MNNKTISILLIIIIVAVLGVVLFNKFNESVIPEEDALLFEKDEGWGPCPSNSICHQSTKLYYSGILTMEGAKELQKQLDKETITQIINKIKSTDIMNKNCSAPIVLDYSAYYKLNIDNQEKTIQFPGCENELLEIEQLIPSE